MKQVQLVACLRPFSSERLTHISPYGKTISEMLDEVGATSDVVVVVDGFAVPQELWKSYIPAPESIVTVRAVPSHGGGDGKDILRTVAAIAVVAAAGWAAPQVVSLLGMEAYTAAGAWTVATKAAMVTLSTAGMLALNALIPPPQPKLSVRAGAGAGTDFLRSPSISGGRNPINKFGPIPKVYGRCRVVPPFAARPYTEIVGNDQYLRELFAVGYGPLKITDLKIGETSIEEFEDVEYEVCEGRRENLDEGGSAVDNGDGTVTLPCQNHCFEDGREIKITGTTNYDGLYKVVSHTENTFDISASYVSETFDGSEVVEDAPVTLFTENVQEESLSTLLEYDVAQTKTTEADTEEISVDITFPQGLVSFDDYGNKGMREVGFEIQYSPHGENDWSVGRTFTSKAEQTTEEMPPPGYEAHYDEVIGDYSIDQYRVDRVVINKYTGDAVVLYGRAKGALWLVKAPPCPSWACLCAKITRSNGCPITDSDIVDERSAGCLDYESADDFKPQATSPASNKITIAAGSIRLRPSAKANETKTLRLNYRMSVPKGQYDVRIRRTTPDSSSTKIYDKAYWTALRSIKHENPLNAALPLATVAIRIKATDQLQGVVDTFNCVATSILPDYSPSDDKWIRKPTRNPASIYRDILQGDANKRAVDDSRVDLEALAAWHRRNAATIKKLNDGESAVDKGDGKVGLPCTGHGFKKRSYVTIHGTDNYDGEYYIDESSSDNEIVIEADYAAETFDGTEFVRSLERSYNQVIDYMTSVEDALWEVAAAGRAAPTYLDGKYSVVEDRPLTTPVQHFTPRNSWNFSMEKVFVKTPHAFRVLFPNEEQNWEMDERIVYDDGYSASNATDYEQLELPGITHSELAYKHARYHLAVAKLRPETYSWYADVEHIVCTRGDLVRFSHDVLQVGLSWGRVISIQTSGGNATGVTLDEFCPMVTTKQYAIRFRKSDGTSLLKNVETKAEDGEYKELDFETPFPEDEAPAEGDLFLYGERTTESMELIIKSIEPVANLAAKITAVDAAPAVHDADVTDIPAYDSQMSFPPYIESEIGAPQVDSIRSDEAVLVRESDGSLRPRIVVTFKYESGKLLDQVVAVEGMIRPHGGTVRRLRGPIFSYDPAEITFDDVEEGIEYTLSFRYHLANGKVGPASSTTHTAVGKTSAPEQPSDISATAQVNSIRLNWTNPVVKDFSHVGIWRNTSDSFPEGDPDLVVKGAPGEKMEYVDTVPTTSQPYYYWFKSYDTSGNASTQTSSYSTTPKVDNNLLKHTIDKAFSDNSPSAGYVSWAGVHVYYDGVVYEIADGNTNKKYIYWDKSVSTTEFQTSDDLPTLDNEDFLVATNDGGSHTMVWNATLQDGKNIFGIIQSANWSASEGSQIDLTAGTIKLGGSSNPDFDVDADGKLTAANAVIDGTINAAAGTFTGYVTAGTARFGKGVQTGKDGLWLDANNYWYTDGMKATTGTVGGWTLGTDTLSAGNITLDADSTYPSIRMGDATGFMSGTGIWMGKHTDGNYTLHIGNPNDQYLKWDGSDLTITGAYIGSSDIGATTANTFTINDDADDVNVQLILDRTTGGAATLQWNGSELTSNISVDVSGSLQQLATKDYVDLSVTSLGASYYMSDTSSGIEDYQLCTLTPSSDAEVYIEGSRLSDGDYIGGWISASGGTPNVLLTGGFNFYITAEKMSGTKTLKLYWKMYERKSDTSETLIATSSISDEITDSKDVFVVPMLITSDYEPDSGSRIVGKLYASVTGGGSAPTVRIYYEGGTGSRWDIPANSEVFRSIFVPYTDAVKDVDLGSHSMTVNDLTVSSPSNIYALNHDSFTGFVANEHIDHSTVSINAGTGLSGGGNITTSRTLSLSHLGLESLSDPGADRIMFWDDSESTLKWLGLGNSLTISTTTLDAVQDIRTSASPTFATAKLTNLSDGYLPYHVSDASGLANSPVYTDGTNVCIGGTKLEAKLWVRTGDSGQTTPSGNADELVIEGGDHSGITILSPNSSVGSVRFGDPEDADVGIVRYSHVDNDMSFWTTGNRQVTIDENGNLGLGTTTPRRLADFLSTSQPQLRLTYSDNSIYTDFQTNSNGNLIVSPTGDFVFNPTGNDIYPNTNYDLNLGLINKKFLSLHAAELWVETLVAQNTLATIGGRILVGPTTTLTSDLGTSATTIYVKHNNLSNGDRIYMEADGKVEFMSVDSDAGGSGPYSYTVTRDLKGSGANQWYAGDAVFNTGAVGDGFIDIYSMRGIKEASDVGPTIVGNIRTGTGYNEWVEGWAIGNLNGLYGYGSDIYGAAFGKYSAADYITIDSADGIRFFDSSNTVQAQLSSGVWTLGEVASSKSNVQITAGTIKLRTNTTSHLELSTSGAFWAGDTASSERVEWNSTDGLFIADASNNKVFQAKPSGDVAIAGTVDIGVGAFADLPDDENLVGYWSFDDGSGSVAVDGSGNGNDGTLVNMEEADWVDGVVGKALEFDGVDEYVDCGNAGLDLSGDGTISLWINSSATYSEVIILIDRYSGSYGYAIFFDSATTIALRFGTDSKNSISVGNLLDGNSHHIVMVRDSGTFLKLYVDGVEKYSGVSNGSDASVSSNTHIGGRGETLNFDGLIDEVRIYNRALTASEIKALYLYPAGNKGTRISGNQTRTGKIQSNNWVDGTSGSVLDLDNELFAIKDDTFGNAGIQLMWADSKAKFYAGDGSDRYFKFDGTDISWKGVNTELTAAGAFTASNATITGAITANTGYIGGTSGWTISSKTLTGASDSKIVSGILESSDWGASTGSQLDLVNKTLTFGGSDDYKFKVSADGTLEATGATISGVITATSGTFTGTVNATDGTFSGHVTAGTAKFGVDVTSGNDGIWLDANNYWYTSGIKATTGTVGGWTLSSTALANGSDIVLNASEKKISIKSSSFGSSGIQLDYNGGSPQFYVGDGANEYLKYVQGTGLSLSTAQANAITVKSGGSIEIEYGGDILLTHGGDIKFTSVTAPTACTASLIATETGNVDNGSHYYKITYVNDTGETELGAASNSVTVDDTHKQVSLTDIPTSSSGSVIARRIYRTKAGGSYLYYLTTINDNTTTTYTDNKADADLGTEINNNRYNNTYGKVIIDGKVCLDIGNNVFVGVDAGKDNSAGYANTFLGFQAGYENTSGNFNTFLGYSTAWKNTTGGGNVFVGSYAGNINTGGSGNVFLGRSAGVYNQTGNYNVFLGRNAGYNNQTGSRNICLGYYAGSKVTGSDILIIDNRVRTSNADEQAKAILYGTMADAPANQTLKINAATTVSQSLSLASGTSVNEFSTDTTLAGNSDDAVPTEKAVKQYVDGGSRAGLPAFLAVKTTAQSNIAVNTAVDVTFETEIYDQGNDFSSSTFTAPATGKYHFDVGVMLGSVDTAATYYDIRIVTSNRTYFNFIDPNFTADVSVLTLTISVDADMDANDTAKVQIYQSGGTQQTDLVAPPTGYVYHWFSGHRIA